MGVWGAWHGRVGGGRGMGVWHGCVGAWHGCVLYWHMLCVGMYSDLHGDLVHLLWELGLIFLFDYSEVSH